MINYKIKRVHPLERVVSAVFSKEGKLDYHGSLSLPDEFTEEDILSAIDVLGDEATRYWRALDQTSDIVLSSTEGSIPDVVFEPYPEPTDEFLRDYDPAYQKVKPLITKTDTTKTYGWQIIDLTDAELAQNVRHKRDAYLRQTDVYGFADREMPTEMTTYRQSLRDLTNQEGFPRDITWPIQPSE